MNKIYKISIILLVSQNLFAQRFDVPLNLPNYDRKPIHFGFLIGLNTLDFKITSKKNIDNNLFGEGGAGTYSDGKLYTRSKKRGSIINILETFVFHGAKEDILIESQPHIGTNKLPKIIESIRKTIITYGGEIHFNSKVIDI